MKGGAAPRRSAQSIQEPLNIREWQTTEGRLFTCGRPGRAIFGREKRPIGQDTIHVWVQGLPPAETVQIVSLLGHKKNGYSEFAYYPFRSSKESGPKPTFQEWLSEHYGSRFVVHEFPTVDAMGIPKDVLTAITTCVSNLLANGQTVVLVDSAGAVRTNRVCKEMGLTQEP